jgi:hypothetical protein
LSFALSTAVLAVGTAGGTALGFLLGVPWLLPILGAAPAYPFYAANLARGRARKAVLLMAIWALLLSAALILATMAFPYRAEQVVWRGTEYTAEMIGWIKTGIGAEGTPSLFLPQHALHFVTFSAACLASAGLGGLVMGAALLNYMNFYAATLILEASNAPLAACLAWPPWAILRVIGFILASVPLSVILMRRFRLRGFGPNISYWRYYLWGSGLVILDAALKALLAPHWRQFLVGAFW